MNQIVRVKAFLLVCVMTLPAFAAPVALQVQSVTDGVWALVGEKAQRSPENLANNATFGVIDTTEGLVLVDPGGSRQGAIQIERAIRGFSDKAVILVINTGGQDHRWLGNAYWKEKGARIVASAAAVADQQARFGDQLGMLQNLIGAAGIEGTEAVHAGETFENEKDLSIGGVNLQLRHFGAAHTPGDSIVWLPDQRVLFSGDIVYLERMLGVGPQSDLINWLQAYKAMRAFPARMIVPGHGRAAEPELADRHTGDYLQALYRRVLAFIDDGGMLADISQVDQSEFMFLETADQLAGRNAHQAFQQLEFAD